MAALKRKALRIHGTMLVLDVPVLSPREVPHLGAELERFVAGAKSPSILPADFARVRTMSSPGIGALLKALSGGHVLAAMRLRPPCEEVIRLLGLAGTLFRIVAPGACPGCGVNGFDHAKARCSACGKFDAFAIGERPPA